MHRRLTRLIEKLATLLGLVAVATVLAAAYGALHDQLSYTASPEYFTRFKFVQFAAAGVAEMPPRLGAAVVGALATWWVGLIAGVVVGVAGLAHREPAPMVRRTLRAFAVVAAVALCTGVVGLAVGWFGFGSGEGAAFVDWWRPPGLLSPRRFFAAGMMHDGSYLGGALGVLAAVVYQLRTAWSARRALTPEPVAAATARSTRAPRWVRVFGGVFLALVLLAFAAAQLVAVGVTEYYSRAWHAASSTDAVARGILRARPALPVRDVRFEGAPLHVRDAWVEQATRIEYRWYLWRRQVLEPRYRLVLLADPVRVPRHYDCDEWLAYADTVRLGDGGDDFFTPIAGPPFPDTVRLRVVRPHGRGGAGC